MAEAGTQAPLFHAVLTAQRSLGVRGFAWAAGVLVAFAALSCAVFLALGAWPVVGFVGVEIGLALLLLWLHQRAGRGLEELTLDDEALTVTRVDAAGRRVAWRLQPAWLRVALRPAEGDAAAHVQLASHGRTLAIGAFLTRDEQAELVTALEAALARWRAPASP
ncbi:DUF2244 domain-containing protein [Elioraea sp.]|uniref:DUF2244 domain-containing protein n=1 Tax=Elioraea sp. TaxID=2185103 RepID=UPI0025BF4EC4|nr:DUF2244 domain-containing protein [Elioraea sp.]